jgi:hypothetical protein
MSGRGRRVEDVREEAPEAGDARRELEPGAPELDDRDSFEELPMEHGVGLDVALDDGGDRQAPGPPIRQEELDRGPRLVTQVASRARVQDEIGEGSAHDRHRTPLDAACPPAGSGDRE